MIITEAEHIALITQSSRYKVVQCRFGPGWVSLVDSPDNQWSIDAVKIMREERDAAIAKQKESGE